MTAADKYYLKAQDYYPCNLEEVLEALEYGLSCDEEHAGLHTLKGKVYYHYLKQFEAAKECFELALFYDKGFVDAYYAYIDLLLTVKAYTKAEKLIETAKNTRGIDMARIRYLESRLAEQQGRYREAIHCLHLAKQQCISRECFTFLGEELERVQTKHKTAEEQKQVIRMQIK